MAYTISIILGRDVDGQIVAVDVWDDEYIDMNGRGYAAALVDARNEYEDVRVVRADLDRSLVVEAFEEPRARLTNVRMGED